MNSIYFYINTEKQLNNEPIFISEKQYEHRNSNIELNVFVKIFSNN